MPTKNVAADIVAAIINDMTNRSGFEDWFNMDRAVQNEIKYEWEDIIHEKLGTERPNLGMIPEPYPIVRYYRPKVPQCSIPPEGWYCTRAPGHDGPCAALPGAKVKTTSNLGGMCLVFRINYSLMQLEVGWSIYDHNQNFNRREALAKAQAMLYEAGSRHTLHIRYDGQASLVDHVHLAIWGAISGNNDALINELNAVTRGNIRRINLMMQSVEITHE